MAAKQFCIGFDGPPEEGKTTLIEHLLKSNRNRMIAAARLRESESESEFVKGRAGEIERSTHGIR